MRRKNKFQLLRAFAEIYTVSIFQNVRNILLLWCYYASVGAARSVFSTKKKKTITYGRNKIRIKLVYEYSVILRGFNSN